MWPVASASTTTRSYVRSRTSWHSLPTPRISLTPGAASATKSNVRASGPMRPSSGILHEQPEVLAQRVLGVHRHRQQVRFDLAGLELQRRGVEGVGERALGVHLAHERAPAGAGREMGDRGRDRCLADPSLARDEQQPAIEERWVHRRQVSPRSRCGDRRRACRPRCRRCSPTERRPAAALVDEPQHVGGAAERGFDPGVHVVALVVGDLDVELARGMGHADSYVHGRDGSRVGGPIGTDGDGGIRGGRVIDATAASDDAVSCASGQPAPS